MSRRDREVSGRGWGGGRSGIRQNSAGTGSFPCLRKISGAAATIVVGMSDDSQSSAAAFDPHPVLDWPALLARHDRWLRTAVLARLREPEGVDEVMQRVAVAAIEQRAPLL